MSGFEELYKFRDGELLKKALTHKSANASFNNDELECLGDGLLDFIAAEKYFGEGLYAGEITEKRKALVSDEAIRQVSKELGLDSALIVGNGYELKGDDKAVPSVYEAYIAAIYLDGGIEEAKRVALQTLTPLPDKDYISILQELLQGEGKPLPGYSDGEDLGNEQEHIWQRSVTVGDNTFTATAGNKKKAKKEAARLAYEYLTNTNQR